MSVSVKKNIFENKNDSKNYVEVKLVGKGGFSNVFLVEEEISREK